MCTWRGYAQVQIGWTERQVSSGQMLTWTHFFCASKLHKNSRGCRRRLCRFSGFWSTSKEWRVTGMCELPTTWCFWLTDSWSDLLVNWLTICCLGGGLLPIHSNQSKLTEWSQGNAYSTIPQQMSVLSQGVPFISDDFYRLCFIVI